MKKIIALALAAVLLLTSCAALPTTAEEKEDIQEVKAAIQEVEEAVQEVKATIQEDKEAIQEDTPHKVLLIMVNDTADAYSDKRQVTNALENGGHIIFETFDNRIVDYFPEELQDYGALNGQGSFFIAGTVLNYVASLGWEFKQAETLYDASAIINTYYFTK